MNWGHSLILLALHLCHHLHLGQALHFASLGRLFNIRLQRTGQQTIILSLPGNYFNREISGMCMAERLSMLGHEKYTCLCPNFSGHKLRKQL